MRACSGGSNAAGSALESTRDAEIGSQIYYAVYCSFLMGSEILPIGPIGIANGFCIGYNSQKSPSSQPNTPKPDYIQGITNVRIKSCHICIRNPAKSQL